MLVVAIHNEYVLKPWSDLSKPIIEVIKMRFIAESSKIASVN